MEEEGQQERLQFLQRHITTQPCRENVRKDPRAAHSSENRTSPQRHPIWLQKRKRVYRCNLYTPTTVREGDQIWPGSPSRVRWPRKGLWSSQQRQIMEGPWAVLCHGPTARQHPGHLCQQQERSPHRQRTPDWFPVTSGVRQGCNLSPLFFVIYMDQITKEANPDPEALNELMFADDQAMMNNDKSQNTATGAHRSAQWKLRDIQHEDQHQQDRGHDCQ